MSPTKLYKSKLQIPQNAFMHISPKHFFKAWFSTIKVVEYEEWVITQTKNEKTNKQATLLKQTLSRNKFIEKFRIEVGEFEEHVRRVTNIYEELANKENLKENECTIQMDFAHNYECVPMAEVQAGYYNRTLVTIHPIVITYRKEEKLRTKTFCVVSDDSKHHTASEVYAFLNETYPEIKKIIPNLTMVHYITDSPQKQYKNQTTAYMIHNH